MKRECKKLLCFWDGLIISEARGVFETKITWILYLGRKFDGLGVKLVKYQVDKNGKIQMKRVATLKCRCAGQTRISVMLGVLHDTLWAGRAPTISMLSKSTAIWAVDYVRVATLFFARLN